MEELINFHSLTISIKQINKNIRQAFTQIIPNLY